LREPGKNEFSSNTTNRKGNFKEAEKEYIISVLENNSWNRTKAAKELNINPSTLWRKMKKFGIN
jgi:transcriptional regulator of acetoin/glycerol metabolism